MRRNAVKIFDESCEFELGKGIVLKEGTDVTILASGIMTAEALDAYEILKEKGINAEIINIHTIKPLDTDLILKSVKKTGAVVTCENHSVINGLGSAVSEFLMENYPVPLKRVGVKDHFGEVGLTEFLKEKYGLKAQNIVSAAEHVLSLK